VVLRKQKGKQNEEKKERKMKKREINQVGRERKRIFKYSMKVSYDNPCCMLRRLRKRTK
jgi:hypothetical protein